MKYYMLRFLLIIGIICLAVTTTSCKNEYKDMLAGEVRLKENDYRNDNNINTIEVKSEHGTTSTISALELRTLWHAVIINAEKNFEYKTEEARNTYDNPKTAEEQFNTQLANSLSLLSDKYPDSYQAIIKELCRSEVHVYIKYVWCAQTDEYVNLKFEATPHIHNATYNSEAN